VASTVGRAELLSALFFCLSVSAYSRNVFGDPSAKELPGDGSYKICPLLRLPSQVRDDLKCFNSKHCNPELIICSFDM